ncbi:hypothetical protein ACFPT7_15575 [Acidicapsa dinghuensis]|uniref:Uncharacterized protein n=1 Tax=Acidicapsa dinghuensis TaxID=2218256 RepID=A0ABW1EKD0_9BACT|nr:hypothetical protein [Acidicapsa dinghuensis]
MKAVEGGVSGIEAFARTGGRFIGQKNSGGQTAAMLAAASSPEVIAAFRKAGGTFTEEKDSSGHNAADYVLQVKPHPDPGAAQYYRERAKAIDAFAEAGGRFALQDGRVSTNTIVLLMQNPASLCAFRRAIGPDVDLRSSISNIQELMAVNGGATAIQAFAAAGHVFTSNNSLGESAAQLAARKGASVLQAYDSAVERQGGLEYISTDDEYSALRSPAAVESFAKAGCKFDDRPNRKGLTAEATAILHGAKVVEAFSEYGGKFTNRLTPQGLTAGDMARREELNSAGVLIAYRAALKRQGGLIFDLPKDEYEATRIGAPGIEAFVHQGGRFTDTPNVQDLTSAIIAASSGAEAIEAFARAGGHFTDWQNKQGYTAAMAAAYSGADAIAAFAEAGGHFTEQQNHVGDTAALIVAMRPDDLGPGMQELHFRLGDMFIDGKQRGAAAIEAFYAAGGRFADHQNSLGNTAAMSVIENGPAAIRAFAHAGGHFTEQEDKAGLTAEIYAAYDDPETIKAFSEAGGRFTTRVSSSGMTSEIAAAESTVDQITAYSQAGGVFTDRKTREGWTSAMIATNHGGWILRHEPSTDIPDTIATQKAVKTDFAQEDAEASKAYQEALQRQGGLLHVP